MFTKGHLTDYMIKVHQTHIDSCSSIRATMKILGTLTTPNLGAVVASEVAIKLATLYPTIINDDGNTNVEKIDDSHRLQEGYFCF